MKTFLCFAIIVVVMGCDNRFVSSLNSDSSSDSYTASLEGRVYLIGSTAVTEDWSPPPLEGISTVIVLDANQKPIYESKTDSLGHFNISIEPGVYFLVVKESPIISIPDLTQPITGPFLVTESYADSAYAYFDNGLR